MDRVSIIIPNWNGSALLAKLLRDLQRQSYPIDRVIVVDNGSTDDSARVAKSAGASLIDLVPPPVREARLDAASPANGGLAPKGSDGVDGALTGTPKAGDATLRFSAMSDVAAMIETMPLERAAEAYAKMMSGKARFRMVLTMG